MKASFSEIDAGYMRRALRLAARARGNVEPNPMVGAVLVKNGKIVGEGYHRRFGGPHAEVLALRAAGSRARAATLYVTLEPCCHFGKTPPCTDAILAAGVGRVVAAMVDPFARVRGMGAAILRRRGVPVELGLLETEARRLNAPFITRLTEHRPYIIAKWAQGLDGAMATASGESKWISSEASRERVHVLRGRVDGILIGIGTALADDPLLTARPNRGRDIRRIATRIVLDSQCRLPLKSQLVRTIPFAPLMVVHGSSLRGAGQRRQRALEGAGVMTVGVRMSRAGQLQILPLLRRLAELEYTNILVEGGAEVLGSFLTERLVDEAHVFIAPKWMGGSGARRPELGGNSERLHSKPRFHITDQERSGTDVHLVLRPE